MRFFPLMLVFVCAALMPLRAQTTQKYVRAYPDGSPDTIWQVRNQDTFLIETFWRNGSPQTQSWHQDSIYHFNEWGQIQSKVYEPLHYLPPQWIEALSPPFTYISFNVQQKVVFYPNGKLQNRSYWLGDSLYMYQEWLPNDTLSQQIELRQSSIATFESVYITANKQIRIQWDTLKRFKRVSEFHPNKVLKEEELYSITKVDKYWDSKPVEFSLWDAMGKIQAHWIDSPQHIKPFKDNGLCLYGFMNAKQDTVLPPQFEDFKEIRNKDNSTYYLVRNAQYDGILNAMGDYILRPVWNDLALMDESVHYATESEMFEKLLLRCRTKTGVGVLKMNGEFALNPVYQDVRNYKKDYFDVKINGHYGIVYKTGQVILSPLYPIIRFTPYPDLFEILEIVGARYHEKSRYSLIHQTGKVLLPSLFGELNALSDSCYIAPVFTSGKSQKGIFHLRKGWIIDTSYHWTLDYYANQLGYQTLISDTNELKGLFNLNTVQWILPCTYRVLQSIINKTFNNKSKDINNLYNENIYYICSKNNQWGLFDPKQATWKLPLEYDYLCELNGIYSSKERILLAHKNNQYQFMDVTGKLLSPTSFEAAGKITDGIFFMVKDDKVLFCSEQSFPQMLTFEEVFRRKPYLQKLQTFDNQFIIINKNSKIIVNSAYTIQALENHYAVAYDSVTGKQFLIDTLGQKRPFSLKYNIIEMNIVQNTVIVQDTNRKKLGIVTVEGKTILPCDYFSIHSPDNHAFIWAKKSKSNRLCELVSQNFYAHYRNRDSVTELDGGWQLFDATGKLLISTEFDFTFEWVNGKGIGQVDYKQGLWDTTGRNLIPPRYDKIWYDKVNEIYYLFYTQKIDNQLVGFADKSGKIIKDAIFKNMSSFTGKYAFVETAQGMGIIQQNGDYWIAPSSHALQQSEFNLNAFFAKEIDSLAHIKGKDIRYDIHLFEIDRTFMYDGIKSLDTLFKSIPLEQHLNINNLLAELYARSYFLQGNRIIPDKTSAMQYLLYRCPNTLNSNELHEHRGDDSYTQKVFYKLHLDALKWHGEYVNFWIDRMFLSKYPPSCGSRNTNYQSYNFKWDGSVWHPIQLDNLLILNEQNINYFNQLFVKKLSALKDLKLDCSNPSGYMEQFKNRFCVLEKGLEFQVSARHGYNSDSLSDNQPVLMTWEELKPILK